MVWSVRSLAVLGSELVAPMLKSPTSSTRPGVVSMPDCVRLAVAALPKPRLPRAALAEASPVPPWAAGNCPDAAADCPSATGPTPMTLPDRVQKPDAEALEVVRAFRDYMRKRHSARDYSSRQVPEALITMAIEAAAIAPSGANHQLWHFVAISDPAMKARIREAAEEEELQLYSSGASDESLAALEPISSGARA